MELLVTLRNVHNIEKILSSCDGVILGSKFTSGFNYSINDISKIASYCKANNRKVYIALDDFIVEEQLMDLNAYLEFIRSLDVDGIYYHDFAVYEAANIFGLKNKLIYDGKNVLCNSLEASFHLSKGNNGIMISRELTKTEALEIVSSYPSKIDMQVFGHLRLSYSKRRFVSNYLKQINSNIDIKNKESLTLVEELRDYKMPIIEDDNGTKIYSDFVFEMYEEFPEFSKYINRAVIDSMFISDNTLLQVVRDYRKLTNENCKFLKERLYQLCNDDFSSGYLYQKVAITKQDE